MNKKELEVLEGKVMEQVVRRRGLGGYSAEAEGILNLSEWMLRIVQHLMEQVSRKEQLTDKKKK